MGLDFGFDMDFTILQDDPEREIIPVNKEDQDAVKGPGLVQSMLEAQDEYFGLITIGRLAPVVELNGDSGLIGYISITYCDLN